MADEVGDTTSVPAATDAAGIRAQVREFVKMSFLFDGSNDELDDTDSFMGAGIVDATGVLELVLFVEETWGLTVDNADLLPENFDSVEALAGYVERRLAAK
jgi:acyl carrier protein